MHVIVLVASTSKPQRIGALYRDRGQRYIANIGIKRTGRIVPLMGHFEKDFKKLKILKNGRPKVTYGKV
jgi:hypothetical protein